MKKNENSFTPEAEKYFSLLTKIINANFDALIQKLEEDLSSLWDKIMFAIIPRDLPNLIKEETEVFRIFLKTKNPQAAVLRGKLMAERNIIPEVIFSFFYIFGDFFREHIQKEDALAFKAAWEVFDTYTKAYTTSYNKEQSARIYTDQGQLHNTLLQKEREEHQAKWDYLVYFAHESRVPISMLKACIMDIYKELGDTFKSESLPMAEVIADKMWQTTMNILDQEKIEQGKILYEHDRIVDISEAVNLKIAMFATLTKADNTKFRIIPDVEKNLYVRINEDALDRILNNIIENAYKFSWKEGVVHISLKRTGGRIVFTVKDSGCGIPEERLSNLYIPYHQNVYENKGGGLKTGLYLVQKILEEVCATINIKSKVNKGAIVKIAFAQEAITPENEDKIVHQSKTSRPVLYRANDLTPDKYNKNNRTMLIVDDNIEDFLIPMQRHFRKRFNCYCAINGRDALEKLGNMPHPDIIISDVKMEEMNGFEFCAQVHEKSELAGIPFIFLSAKSAVKERINGLKLGALAYLKKPFSMDELDTVVENLLHNRDLTIEREIRIMESKLSKLLREKGHKGYSKFDEICEKLKIPKRQKDVFRLLLKGKFVKEIAPELGLSINTVRKHIREIYRKCGGVQNRVELLNFLGITLDGV